MKTFYIESRVTRIENLEVIANNRKEAIEKAESAEFKNNWDKTHDEVRQLVSIS